MEPTGNEFKPIVIPKSLVDHILMTTHDHGGHNGFLRMYAAIRHLYFWVSMKRDIDYNNIVKDVSCVQSITLQRSSLRRLISKELDSLCSLSPWI